MNSALLFHVELLPDASCCIKHDFWGVLWAPTTLFSSWRVPWSNVESVKEAKHPSQQVQPLFRIKFTIPFFLVVHVQVNQRTRDFVLIILLGSPNTKLATCSMWSCKNAMQQALQPAPLKAELEVAALTLPSKPVKLKPQKRSAESDTIRSFSSFRF